MLYYARISGADYNGYYNPQLGPSFGQAYLTITPEAIGNLHLSWRVGAFVEVYGGPGQWGWGIFGPLLGVRGMGETTSADIDELSPQATVARVRLAGAAGTRDITADLGLGLALAAAAG